MEAITLKFPPEWEQRLARIEAHISRSPDRRTADSHREDLPGPAKDWWTNAEAQSYLGLSKMTLQRYRDSGILPYSKVGANIYYRRTDVLALLERNLKRTGQPA